MKRIRGLTLFSFITGLLMLSAMFVPVSISQNPVNEVSGTPAGWSDDVRLTYATPDSDKYAAISTWESQVHITWRKLLADRSDIYYINSTNSGQNWNHPIRLSEGVSGIYCMYPDIGMSSGNNIHIVWNDNDATGFAEIQYRNSTDGGITWNPSKMISSDDGETSERPIIRINGSEIHVLWVDHRHGSESFPPNTELYYVRSLDGGITWDDGIGNVGQERRLTNAFYDSVGQDIGVEGEALHLVWGDARNGVTTGDIYYKRSLDKGATWDDGLGNINQDRRLTNNLTSNHGIPTIAVNGSSIHVAWMDVVGPSYYLYYRNSTDKGANWNPIQLLVDSGMAYNPSVDVIGNEVHVVWDDWRDTGSTKEVYYKNSTDGGVSWSPETRLTSVDNNSSAGPKIALSGNYRHITWEDQRDGNREIYYKRYPDFPTDPTYNISLDEGWNLVSLPLVQSDESIDQVLSSINGKWDCIQTYDPLSPEAWKTNNTHRPNQLNDFSTLNHKQGFWINITEPGGTILTVSGYNLPSTSISLYAGWNLMGYPSLTNETVANALWGTGADSVEVFDPGEPYRIREVGPTYAMRPGEGYWVHVPADTVWVVDW